LSSDRELEIKKATNQQPSPSPSESVDAFAMAVASCLGVGRFPIAPGTAGSVAGIFAYLVLRVQPVWLYSLSVAALTALAVWAADRAERILRCQDPPLVVIDEVVGLLVTLAWLPHSLYVVALGFFLFRAFDILKVPPIRWVERMLPGGLGVVGDDVLAGIYANICVRFVLKIVV
jgi:phosphatidylglycerophosphatase A